MTEKRYYQKKYEESYYIFDSNTISEDDFEERVEYEGYDVFADSLTGSEIIDLLNENEELKQSIDNMGGRLQGLWANYNENRYGIWSEAVEDVAKELGFKIYKTYDAPISMSNAKKERINGVKKLNEIIYENKQLKEEIKDLNDVLASYEEIDSKKFNQSNCITVQKSTICDLKKENEQLKIRFNEEREKSLKFCRNIDTLTIENEQLKQIPSKLDSRIQKLQDGLNKLSEMDTKDLNPKAVEDVSIVLSISLDALLEFRKELEE